MGYGVSLMGYWSFRNRTSGPIPPSHHAKRAPTVMMFARQYALCGVT